MQTKSIRIGFLGYEGMMALDLVGPFDAFSSAFTEGANGELEPCYEPVIIGLTRRPFASENGIVFRPHKTIANAPSLDTLIIPGGKGLRVPETQSRVARWVGAQAENIRRIATVCTGAFGLAATGLLEGRKVTTHWRQAAELSTTFPQLNVDGNSLYLKDGKFYTCAGVTAGIDLSLALIQEDFGPRVALSVARELVVYLKRPGGQEQFSEPLKFQTKSLDRFAELGAFIQGHLTRDLSAEALAERTNLSPRHFARRFKSSFGTTPAAFVEDLRLREARERLTLQDQTVKSVAQSVGFKSDDAFRRAFERRYRIPPTVYRKQFGSVE
ncbi:MAG TPA: helix-turn-helix domain-containing protein [Pyrinomonadaceae bacterium]|nr:helix-turn-helix domain-containing protein [Pyrinomonadaceae bacterium]